MKSVEGFLIASFGMSGYKGFEVGKNGVFVVLPSGRPNCWKHYRWYTPTRGGSEHYGNWSFLKDGATPGNGVVENWFELLESWFHGADEKGEVQAAPGAKQELERLQGEWTMVSLEQRGEKAPADVKETVDLGIKAQSEVVDLFVKRATANFEEIKSVFENKTAMVARCYVQGIESEEVEKTKKGFVTVGVTVTTDGKASNVRVLKSSFGSPAVDACVVEMVQGWEFTDALPKPLDTSHTYVMDRF